jgi:acetoin utilization deacetylase AcuC-like enzyme
MAAAPVFLAHPSSLAHDTGGHPEQAARIVAIERELESRGWLGYERRESVAVDRRTLVAVHPEPYVDAIEAAAAAGGGMLDADTIVSSGSFEAALHGAGGAVQLVDLLLERAVPTGFSSHRPPGHHALASRAMGFCLFNNVAVAAQHAVDARDLDRVLIFDWDVHHGNGTNDIFHASDSVLYVSIHQSPLYPGTGPFSDVGSGPGEGYTVNLPVPPGAGDELWLSVCSHVVVPLARAFRPELFLLSAGFDAHRDDPLANCEVTEEGFASMAALIRALCSELDAPLGAVLEGGYGLNPLARSVAATMEVLGAPEPPPAVDADVAPGVREVRARLERFWPGLGEGL